ncbi:hypothetical protein H072_4945 [Dactylellina haptotyla CBS 200.50]|uniref:Cell wall protein PhiA n=1 Tax=Dactylellina haptotyla (strain CBS 200.50) TaxID=1284197 RepID=S8BNS5_DACHA|nr:hypothetical protein H072_4945 [Dactylellina haptotyla CBS 200.50]
MVFAKAATIFSLLAAVSAIPALEPRAVSATNPVFIRAGGGDPEAPAPFFGLYFSANGGYIWLGKDPSFTCDDKDLPCSQPQDARVAFRVSNYIVLDSNGGQKVYVAPNGALSFTKPTKGVVPSGSVITGFKLDGNNLLAQDTEFIACPTNKDDHGPWKVFSDIGGRVKDSDVPTKKKGDCTRFTAVVTSNKIKQYN